MTPEPTMTPENTSLSQLRLRCRRGMLELDLIMERYLEHHYESADREEQKNLPLYRQKYPTPPTLPPDNLNLIPL